MKRKCNRCKVHKETKLNYKRTSSGAYATSCNECVESVKIKPLKCSCCKELKPRDYYVFYKDGSWNQKCKDCKENKKERPTKPFTGKRCVCCKEVKDSRTDFDKSKSGINRTKCKVCFGLKKPKKIRKKTCKCCNLEKKIDIDFKRYESGVVHAKCIECESIVKESKVVYKEEPTDPKDLLTKVKKMEEGFKLKKETRSGLSYKGAIIYKRV